MPWSCFQSPSSPLEPVYLELYHHLDLQQHREALLLFAVS